ncbi:MAG: hypothetical protein AAF658_06120, partial [Myxococcota bacterium]
SGGDWVVAHPVSPFHAFLARQDGVRLWLRVDDGASKVVVGAVCFDRDADSLLLPELPPMEVDVSVAPSLLANVLRDAYVEALEKVTVQKREESPVYF